MDGKLTKIYSASVNGIDATLITIEVSVTVGYGITIVGLPDTAVKESAERIKASLRPHQIKLGRSNIVINMAPADVKKEGAAFDLPLAIGIMASCGKVPEEELNQYMIMGELSLDGSVMPIKGVLPMAILARSLNMKGFIVPKANEYEAAVVNNLDIYGVENISDVIDLLSGTSQIQPTVVNTREEFAKATSSFPFDFSEVRGQENVKRALEVAAAGGHNILLIGAPGSGKSMMAKRLPSILPPLTLSESLETTKIHSVAGKLPHGTTLLASRPFRSPHHTISQVAACGGGASYPVPGEISLAHNGILFLDELPEFSRSVLEVMRQPLEDRVVSIARAKYNVEYPASFMLVASMNPCPCGYYDHPTKPCTCNPGAVIRYMNRISGPLLDRIDLHISVESVGFEQITSKAEGEPSAVIRERVMKARGIQEQRFAEYSGIHCNAQMTSAMLRKYAYPNEEGLRVLKESMTRLNLSARAFDRILKVARTIADLSGEPYILVEHLHEAISYRSLDRGFWGN